MPSIPRLLVVVLLCVACMPAGAAGYQLPGRVLRVIDGDSLVIDVRGSLYQVELAGIDAPELNQPWGLTAAQQLQATLTGMFVVVDGSKGGTSIEGSVVFKGRDVALDMLYDGLAWSTIPDDQQHPAGHPYPDAQQEARAAHRGLWSDAEPVAPWDWRRGHNRPVD